MRPAEYPAFMSALCEAEAPAPAFVCAPEGAVLADRLAVYRNNVHVSLVESLARTYPVVRAQVGDEFFRAMARVFVQAHKPASPELNRYGARFPDFIGSFAPAESLAWLPDLARLEWAWLESWAAADAPALRLAALKQMTATGLMQARAIVHPAARLVRAAWPVADLWQAHQQGEPDLSALRWQPQNVLLTRPQADVMLRQLDDADALFAAALMEGDTVEVAAARSSRLDAGWLLAQLIGDGMILEFGT